MTSTLRNLAEIKRAAKAAGNFFFTPSSLRYWNSTVLSEVYPSITGTYFVTGESFDGERAYTVRVATDDADGFDVRTVGDFMGYASAEAAKAAAKKFSRNA